MTQVATVVPAAAPAQLPEMKVQDVQIQIGVGSPIPLDAFISAELPDICAQLAEVKVTQKDFTFDITLRVTPGTHEECFRDTLPFRMVVPLNMLNQPAGTYTVNVNGASTKFQWPTQPTVTPESGMTVPAEWETYRNDAIHFEIDYPPGWIVEESGDTDILWSEKPIGPGHDGVPNNVVKIDIVTEPNTTTTLEELVQRQKQIIADSNGKVLLEEPVTLGSGLPAVRIGVSGIADSVILLAVINGHPVMLVGYGDLGRFDEVACTLRSVEP
ncbi:MAG TPA: hypothetical protein VMP08_10815 [Anaerolineae bacterium]|nr:hypothetical protein [Anaerolineae bacterium]